MTEYNDQQLGEVSSSGIDTLGKITQSVRMTKSVSNSNDTTNRRVRLNYSATVYEQSNLTSKEAYQNAVDSGVLTQDHGGVFWDLLPEEVYPDLSTIKASNGDSISYIKVHENWRNSGRIMLEIGVEHTPGIKSGTPYYDSITVSFTAYYSWDDYRWNGSILTNLIVYASEEEKLGTLKGYVGELDDPRSGYNVTTPQDAKDNADLLKDLDPQSGRQSFLYASVTKEILEVTSGETGTKKEVRAVAEGGGWWNNDDSSSTIPEVYEGAAYVYRVTIENQNQSQSSRDIIFYDSLEDYRPTGTESSWKGTFLSLDLSQIEEKGVDPVVHYAIGPVSLDDPPDLTSEEWTIQKPEDLSTITAIAVDCSKTTGGEPFYLENEETLQAYIYMKAPSGEEAAEAIEDHLYAYNNVSLSLSYERGDKTDPQYVDSGYTKIGLRDYQVSVSKTWEDANDQDGLRTDSITAVLYRDGEATGQTITLDSSNDWKGIFKNLPWGDDEGNQYDYTVKEEDVPKGYTASVDSSGENTFKIINTHEPETVHITGSKTWDDAGYEDKRPETVTFTLYRNGVAYKKSTVSVAADGTWSYDFGELPKYEIIDGTGGYPIDYQVEETYVPGYVTVKSGEDFINQYDPYGDLQLTKTTVAATNVSVNTPFTFVFELQNEDGTYNANPYAWSSSNGGAGTIENGQELTIYSDETITIHRIPSETTYSLRENSASGFKQTKAENLTGTLKAGETKEALCENTYSATGTASISVSKELSGQNLVKGQFRFWLLDEDEYLLRAATNNADGQVNFGALYYSLSDVGKPHTYQVVELNEGANGYTYDQNKLNVSVEVTDKGDGTLSCDVSYEPEEDRTFKNTYQATGTLNLTAHKTLVGRDLKEGEFTFVLKDPAGKVIAKATNDKDGNINFPTVSYTQEDIGETYLYTIQEVKPTDSDSDDNGDQDPDEDTNPDAVDHEESAQAESVDTDQADDEEPDDIDSDVTDGEDQDPVQTADPDIVYDEHEDQVEVTILDNRDGTLTAQTKLIGNDNQLSWKNSLADGTLVIEKRTQGGDGREEFTYKVRITLPEGAELDESKEYSYTLEQIENSSEEPVEDTEENSGEEIAGSEQSQEVASVAISDESEEDEYSLMDSLVSLVTPTTAQAADNVVASGTWGTCPWYIDSDYVLYIKEGEAAQLAYNELPWYSYRYKITKIISSENVDTSKLTSLSQFFYNYSKLEEVDLNSWNTSNVTNMNSLFSWCYSLTSLDGISKWDVSNVTNLSSLLYSCYSLTSLDGISNWNTSQVTNLSYAFYNCNKLTTLDGVKDWKTSSATTLDSTFSSCYRLTELSGLKNWDTKSVTSLNYAFSSCSGLTDLKGLENWDVSSVTSLYNTFTSCTKLTGLDGLEKWKTGKVQNLSCTFQTCYNLKNVNALLNWDTSNVTTLEYLFSNCSQLDDLSGLSLWNVGQVTSMKYMFFTCSSIPNLDSLQNWNVGNVTTLESTFSGCSKLENINGLSSWNIKNVTTLASTFTNCSILANLDGLKLWNTSNVTSFAKTFWGCKSLLDLNGLSSWNVEKETTFSYTFYQCTGLTNLSGIASWNVKNATDLSYTFSGCMGLTSLSGLGSWNTQSLKQLSSTFSNCTGLINLSGIGSWNVSNITKLDSTFSGCSKLTDLSALSSWKTKSLNSLYRTFLNCTGLQTLDGISSWETSTLTSMQETFKGCSSLNSLDGLKSWKTGNVTWFVSCFSGCSSVNSLVPLKNWDTTSATMYSSMFYNCSSLKDLDGIQNWSLKKVSTSGITSMFQGCSSLESLEAISGWDVSSVQSFSYLFDGCSSLKDLGALSGWDTSSAKDLYSTFNGCSSLTNANGVGNWTTDKVTNFGYVFRGCVNLKTVSVKNWDTKSCGGNVTLFYQCDNVEQIELGPNYFNFGSKYYAKQFLPYYSNDYVKFIREDNVYGPWSKSEIKEQWMSNEDPAGWYRCIIPEYTICFDANGGSGQTQPMTVQMGVSTVLNANAFYRFNHTFVSWNTQPDGSGKTYKDKATVSTLTTESNGVVTLYAQWKQNENKIKIRDSEFEITIPANSRATIEGLPGGTTYQVVEVSKEDWVLDSYENTSGTIEPNKTSVAKFLNVKSEGSMSVSFSATKLLDGQIPDDELFTFALIDASGNKETVLQTVTNQGSAVTFEPITISAKLGDTSLYVYKIKEVIPDERDYQYDVHEYISTFTVGMENGEIKVLSNVSEGSSVFENKTLLGTLKVNKEVEGTDDQNKEFSFDIYLTSQLGTPLPDGTYGSDGKINLTDGKGSFQLKAGESLTLDDLPNGTIYQVTEVDIPDGYSTEQNFKTGVVVSNRTSEVTITNQYRASGAVSIDARKVLTNGDLTAGAFSFTLKDAEGKTLSTAVNDADGNIVFDPEYYDQPGTYMYTISEVSGNDPDMNYDPSEKKVTVSVSDNGDGTLNAQVEGNLDSRTFTNSLKTGDLKITKTVTGATDATKDHSYSFNVNLTSEEEALTGEYSWTRTDSNGEIKEKGQFVSGDKVTLKDGESIQISGIPVNTAYEITEEMLPGYTLSGNEELSGVISADSPSTVEVNNIYSTLGEYTPEATKMLTGANIADYSFEFILVDESGDVVSRAWSDEEGKIQFTPISYSVDDDGKTFTYTVSESDALLENIICDQSQKVLKVSVHDNGNGEMETTGVWVDGNIFINRFSGFELPGAGMLSGTQLFMLVSALLATGLVLSSVSLRKKK